MFYVFVQPLPLTLALFSIFTNTRTHFLPIPHHKNFSIIFFAFYSRCKPHLPILPYSSSTPSSTYDLSPSLQLHGDDPGHDREDGHHGRLPNGYLLLRRTPADGGAESGHRDLLHDVPYRRHGVSLHHGPGGGSLAKRIVAQLVF